MKRALFFAAVSVAVSLTATCAADSIGTLIEVSKSMDSAKKEIDADTANFSRLKNAVENGELKTGQSKQSVSERYGRPIVINEDFATGRERWVYKPAGSSFFKGARIALLFNSDGMLEDIVVLR